MKTHYTTTFKFIALWAVLLLIFSCPASNAEGSPKEPDRLEIHFIDVGVGDAILLREYKDDTVIDMMIDIGDKQHTASVTGYLIDRGVSNLQFLVLTHPHADHIGGANTILDNIMVHESVLAPLVADTETYEKVMDKIEAKGITQLYPQLGDVLSFGNAQLELYAPAPVLYTNENDWSLVFMLTYADKRVLFTGDAEYDSEMDMLYNPNLDLHADVLKVGHHGSYTSTSYEFASAVNPSYAVISCGINNKKEYPDVEVGMNLMDAGCTDILTTYVHGTIILSIMTDGSIEFKTEK